LENSRRAENRSRQDIKVSNARASMIDSECPTLTNLALHRPVTK